MKNSKDLSVFADEYKKHLSKYVLSGGDDEVLYEAYQQLIVFLDESTAQAANLLDIHSRALRDILGVKNDNDMVQWIYIQRATEFLLQILIATDALLLSLRENIERDPLTGVYNRIGIDRILSKMWKTSAEKNIPLTVAMADIDDFKLVNDTYGHVVGDELLQEISSLIKRSLREGDAVLRFGGEEFLILLPKADTEGAKIPLERIRGQIENRVFTKKNIKVTISVGAASYPDDRPLSPEELIEFADNALYKAKAQGKNAVVFYGELDMSDK